MFIMPICRGTLSPCCRHTRHAAVNLVQTRGLWLYEKSNERLLRRWRLWREALQQSESKVSICTISYRILRYYISSFYPTIPNICRISFLDNQRWQNGVQTWMFHCDSTNSTFPFVERFEGCGESNEWLLRLCIWWRPGREALQQSESKVSICTIFYPRPYTIIFSSKQSQTHAESLSCKINVGKFKLIYVSQWFDQVNLPFCWVICGMRWQLGYCQVERVGWTEGTSSRGNFESCDRWKDARDYQMGSHDSFPSHRAAWWRHSSTHVPLPADFWSPEEDWA